MAISEDTAALVAAHLTVAWATRHTPVQPGAPAGPQEGVVLDRYIKFRDALRETKIKGG